MITVSRSAVITRKTCAMKRYWAYDAPHPDAPPDTHARGLTPTMEGNALAKLRGTLFHNTMEQVVQGGDIDAYVAEAGAPLGPEQQALVRRAAKGWSRWRSPQLRDRFVPLSAEQEWTWALTPFVAQALRMDLILDDRETGELRILDYKTLSKPDPNWTDRLAHSEQTHLYIQALRERTGREVSMQYEGIIIGRHEDGSQKSPFVSAFSKHGQLTGQWSSGAQRVPTLSWSDDEWLTWAEAQGLPDQLFCSTGRISPSPHQLLATKHATAHAELQWADTLAQLEAEPDPEAQRLLRETLIERNPDACLKYGIGYACPYAGLCWHGHRPDAETFTVRIDHHEVKEPTV
jgi:RecB family exonuclease